MVTDTATPGHLEAAPVRRARLTAALLGLVAVLAVACMASLALGARDVPLGQVLDAVLWPDMSDNDHRAVINERLPRTVLGLIGGAALGLAGVLLQGLTRNPIADPGLLGINAGASLAVVTAISYLGVSGPNQFVWFAFLGAALAALLVYGAASVGRDGATPVRLALVGAALTATATSLITMVLLTDRTALGQYRFWSVGSLVNRDIDLAAVIGPFVAVGAVLALASARFLDAMALGEDLAKGLGASVVRGRLMVLAAVVLLCGGATAMVGPIAFLGLMVPHLARRLVGQDHRWVLPYAAALGSVLLLVADVIGRLVVQEELEAGLVVALIGAPVLIAIVRGSKAVSM
ncbi:MAG TPA: iron chelate uptake ABC transporter family permease subunit [Nocardioides sp.]|nr:iron chelate uptake ABC transporter family permease subunit [Nocardioides sp.]